MALRGLELVRREVGLGHGGLKLLRAPPPTSCLRFHRVAHNRGPAALPAKKVATAMEACGGARVDVFGAAEGKA